MGNRFVRNALSETNWTRVGWDNVSWRRVGQQVAVKVPLLPKWDSGLEDRGANLANCITPTLFGYSVPSIILALFTICLVLEYCKLGDLSNAIHQLTPRNFFFHVSTSIANGMNYLHNRGLYIAIKAGQCVTGRRFCDG
jgi:serine/threonine protein kinase